MLADLEAFRSHIDPESAKTPIPRSAVNDAAFRQSVEQASRPMWLEMSENTESSAANKAALVESCSRACVCCHFGGGLYFLAALSGDRTTKLAKKHARRTAV
jgi:hypothetical protein